MRLLQPTEQLIKDLVTKVTLGSCSKDLKQGKGKRERESLCHYHPPNGQPACKKAACVRAGIGKWEG